MDGGSSGVRDAVHVVHQPHKKFFFQSMLQCTKHASFNMTDTQNYVKKRN